ncbi:riboflavin biosynthesis protein RibF [Taibaiella sp. KBW10]|uniref:bifunctional riboflavin kinase/FAD synthetase n=1 Tax=Taibaiella sp. KBW10 TaxID=2153357 RepID=UPI000F59F82A|nr:bifunctional riboflavin kinase/FAD synthetase [Taibaiella sp. KBW10]RQO31405.1 riboflavin biosynthesis protein RibF [Taibaiella sp. KBW10]
MSVFYAINDLPRFKNPVLTIGSFDGVHQGHQKIIRNVADTAKKVNGESILITFEPHPRKIIQPGQALGLLSSLEEKIERITQEGIDHIVVVPFSRDFSMMSAEDYVLNFLYNTFLPHTIIIGYDHHFGHNRSGNIGTLKEMLPAAVQVIEIEEQLIQEADVSSTKIRKAITKGNIAEATAMLGRTYGFEAVVVHGNKIGRTIGYPTANLQPTYSDILIPGIGIYAVKVHYKDTVYQGMMSIGKRPTVTDDNIIAIEVNILDFQQDIYGEKLYVEFIAYVRGEEKFDGLESLKAQIAQDEVDIRKLLSTDTPT